MTTTIQSRKQLIASFGLTAEEIAKGCLTQLRHVQLTGAQHGKDGMYPDGEFGSDADWVYGIGATIQALETELDIDDGAVFELYREAHSAFYRDGTINPGDRDCWPDIYDMWFGACAPTTVSVHAKSFDDAFETAAQWLHDKHPGFFMSQEEMKERLQEACAERGIDPEHIDWSDLRGADAEAVEAAEGDLTYCDPGLWIRSEEWGGSGPR
jgi:hypothetical protein